MKDITMAFLKESPQIERYFISITIRSVPFSSVVSDSLCPWGLQHAGPPCPSPTPEVYQTHVHGVSDAIQPSPLLSPFLALNLSYHQGLFK